jgi:O-antigen/teichoic acid export membrane protein
VWTVAPAAGGLAIWAGATRTMVKEGLLLSLQRRIQSLPTELRGIWGFVGTTNIMSTLGASVNLTAIRQPVFRAMTIRAVALAGFLLVIAMAGGSLLPLLFGGAASLAAMLLLVVSAASSVVVLGFALDPMLLSFGQVKQALLSTFLPWVIYVPMVYLVLSKFGLIGIGIALVPYRLLQVSLRVGLRWRGARVAAQCNCPL